MRKAEISRKTKETDIKLSLDLDGGDVSVCTGIGFFDHMLTAFAVHAGYGLSLKATGDLNVDGHHTVEDVGIVLGQAFYKALSDRNDIARYGQALIPMDEALARTVVDISRPFIVFDAKYNEPFCGDYECCLTNEFFTAFAINAQITVHTQLLYGDNSHHCVEAIYKSLAHALAQATVQDRSKVLSTKGSL